MGDHGLQELRVVSKTSKMNSSVSAADIMALQHTDERTSKGRLDSAFKHSRSVRVFPAKLYVVLILYSQPNVSVSCELNSFGKVCVSLVCYY